MRVLELEGKVDELTRQLSDARKAGATKDVECERLVARHEAAAAEAEELRAEAALDKKEMERLAKASGVCASGAVDVGLMDPASLMARAEAVSAEEKIRALERELDAAAQAAERAKAGAAAKAVECERLVARHEAAAAEAEALRAEVVLKQNSIGRLEEALSSGPATLGAIAAQAEGAVATKLTPERMRIVKRAALEFRDGMYVNLGIGIPIFGKRGIIEGEIHPSMT